MNVEQVSKLCNLLENPGNENKDFLYEQFSQRIVPGVDDTSLLKAQFLFNICKNKIKSTIISNRYAVNLLGTMQGGYNVNILVNLLDDDELSYYAYKELSKTILIFDSYNDVVIKANKGNYNAKRLLERLGRS